MQKLSVGKSRDCDIIVQGQYISHHHAILIIDGRNVYIEDNGSTNGTYVDGRKIQSRTRLNSNSEVTLGKRDTFDWSRYVPTRQYDNYEERTVVDNSAPRTYPKRYSSPSYNDRPHNETPRQDIINRPTAVSKKEEKKSNWKTTTKSTVGKVLKYVITTAFTMAVMALLTKLLR